MKLKYLFIAFCAFSLSWGSQAAPIDRAKAMKLASRYVRIKSNASPLKLERYATPSIAPSYYIFNDQEKEGFVIVSGDDATSPILGYSATGHLNSQQLPDQLLNLLTHHDQQVCRLRKTPIVPGLPISEPKANPKAIKGPLLRSLWNQNAPYNDQTPLIGKEHTVTGCVGTAMAQLMYYHKWPIRGKGSHSYSTNVGTLSINFEESIYDWENMLPKYVYSEPDGFKMQPRRALWNEAQAKAVSKFMLDAGVAISTSYALSDVGSGSNVGAAAKALTENFSYHTQTLYRSTTPSHQFLSAIKRELDANNPILMVGSHEYSGHAWVIDGYDENGYLHVNWGWGGLSDGYFALSFMSPEQTGIGGLVGGYNEGQAIVLAHPNKNGTEGFANEASVCTYLQPNAGLRYAMSTFEADSRALSIKLERLAKKQDFSYNAKVALSLRNAEGKQVEIFEYGESLEGQARNGVYRDFMINISLPSLPDGAYTLHTMYKAAHQSDDVWHEVGKDIPLHFSVSAGQIVLPDAALQKSPALRFLKPPVQLTPFWHGHPTSLFLSIANPTPFDTEFGRIMMRLTKEGEKQEIPVEQFRFYDNSRFDGLISLSSVVSKLLSVGTYDVEFFFRRTGAEYTIENPFGPYQIEVLESGGKPILSLAFDYASRNGSSRSIAFKKGEEEWKEDKVNLKKLEATGLSLHSILYNSSDVSYKGPLTFVFVHPTTGERHLLETKQDVEIGAGLFSDLVVEMPRMLLETLPKHERLELHIYAMIDGKEREVWGNGVNRRVLVLTETDESPITGVVATHQQTVSLQTTNQNLVLRGAHKGDRLQIVSMSGKLLYQTLLIAATEWVLPLNYLPAGSYVLRVGTFTTKFIVP